MKIRIFSAVIATALLLLSCNDQSRLPHGHFEGSLRERYQNGQVTEKTVHAEIDLTADRPGNIIILSTEGAPVLVIQISELEGRRFKLFVPPVMAAPMTMVYDSGDGCFHSEPSRWVSFCFTREKYALEVDDGGGKPVLTLTGDSFPVEAPLPRETPATYSLSRAVALALRRAYNSRMEFEQVMRAHYTARQAYLNLLPHLSVNSILNGLTPGVTNILQSVGDLLPFLLPTRWIQAREASLEARAEADALLIMQADGATQVEQLAYNLEKDEELVAFYGMLIQKVQSAIDACSKLEGSGDLPIGSTDHLRAIVDSMRLDQEGLLELLKEDRTAVAQALGLNSPDAIQEMTFDAEIPPIAEATPLDAPSVETIAVSRSLEFRQLDSLIEVAKKRKLDMLFNWLDPNGDPNAPLGFSLGETIAISRSRVRELEIRHDQIRQVAADSVSSAVHEYNEAIRERAEIERLLALDEERWRNEIIQLKPKTSVSTMDMEGIIIDYLGAGIRQKMSLLTFRMARSRIDRALLQGYYQDVPVKEEPAFRPY